MQMCTRCNALVEMVNYTLRTLRKELICGYQNPLKTIAHRDKTGLQLYSARPSCKSAWQPEKAELF